MAEKRGAVDQFSNKLYGSATESGANTLTFAEINTSVSVFDKVGWILSRLEWYWSTATRALVTANDDVLQAALVNSNNISTLSLQDPSVIDLIEFQYALGTSVGFESSQLPFIRDFSGLPGGGLIIAPRPLYIAIKGTSLASAASIACRGYFTQLAMSPADYLELIDYYRMVG